MQLEDKLAILADSAKYDVACTSSGTSRGNDGTGLGSCVQMGIVFKKIPRDISRL